MSKKKKITGHAGITFKDEKSDSLRRTEKSGRMRILVTNDDGIHAPGLAAAEKIAMCSRGTPRVANNRLRWVRDYSTSRGTGHIDLVIAEAALKKLEIDHLGLDAQDRKYLETIRRVFNGGPAGVEAIAHTMNAALDTLVDEVEPFLLRSELVVRTPRGRKLTSKAYLHLGATPPPPEPQLPLF